MNETLVNLPKTTNARHAAPLAPRGRSAALSPRLRQRIATEFQPRWEQEWGGKFVTNGETPGPDAVRLDGNHHFEYHNELGAVLYRMGELEAAAEQFRTAEELAPDNPVVKANLGFCYMGMGDRASAGAYFQAFMARPAADASIRLSVQCALDLL